MDYQGNTRKEREEREREGKEGKKELPRDKIEKAIVGEAIRRPKGIGYKFKKTFFGGDAKQALKFVWLEVFLPDIRNITYDMIRGYAERVIFPDTQHQRRRVGTNYRASYHSNPLIRPMVETRPTQVYPYPPSPTPSLPRGRINRQDMDDVILGTREEAELVIERLNDVIEKYQVVSKADLYDMLGWETSPLDNKFGWEYLGNIQIRLVRQGYLLELPMLEEI